MIFRKFRFIDVCVCVRRAFFSLNLLCQLIFHDLYGGHFITIDDRYIMLMFLLRSCKLGRMEKSTQIEHSKY